MPCPGFRGLWRRRHSRSHGCNTDSGTSNTSNLERARNSINADTQVGGSIAAFQPIAYGFSFYLEPGIRQASYDTRDPAFGSTRNDTIYTTTASIIYDLGYHNAQVALTYAWTFADSNQQLFTYHRHQGTLQLTVPF